MTDAQARALADALGATVGMLERRIAATEAAMLELAAALEARLTVLEERASAPPERPRLIVSDAAD